MLEPAVVWGLCLFTSSELCLLRTYTYQFARKILRSTPLLLSPESKGQLPEAPNPRIPRVFLMFIHTQYFMGLGGLPRMNV